MASDGGTVIGDRAVAEAPRAPRRRLSRWVIACYGAGKMGDPVMQGNVAQFTYPFYNVILGVPGWLIGVLTLFPRLWDAVSDPLVGAWSDQCQSRLGRRRPFLLVGAFALPLTFFLYWVPPFVSGNTTGIAIWLLIIGFLLYTAWTIYFIPYYALGYELSPDYDERTSLMASSTAVVQIGDAIRGFAPALGLFLVGLTPWAGNQRAAYGVAGFIFALSILAGGLIMLLGVREPRLHRAPAQMSFFNSVMITLRNRLYLRMVAVQILFLMGLFFMATTVTYLQLYYMNAPWIFGWTNLANAGVSFLCLLPWTWITPRIGKIWSLRIAFLFLIGGAASAFFIYRPGYTWQPFIGALLWGPGWSSYNTMVNAIMADLTDLDELQTGQRREGSYASVGAFVVKLAIALVLALVGPVLDFAVGFDADLGANQGEDTWLRLRLWTVFVPAVLSALALLVLSHFPLTKERMIEVRAELEARRGA